MSSYLEKYVEALCQEMDIVARSALSPIHVGTIYFGGGTPSLLKQQNIQAILAAARRYFEIDVTSEITLEANPGTVDADYLRAIYDLGVNRISFGMQSAHVDDLRMLNRLHQHTDVIQAVKWSKQAGFKHINLDMIFGIPGQTIARWQDSLDLALMEQIDHFSLYSLTIENGTPIQRWVMHGLTAEPDDDLAGEMYAVAMDKLDKAGFKQYEISNWALDGKVETRCRHNLQYWHFLPYLGFGAGAHGFVGNIRTANTNGILDYLNLLNKPSVNIFPESPACETVTRLSDWDRMQEFMMVGLRLTEEGISRSDFFRRFDRKVDDLFSKPIRKLINQKLIEDHPDNHDRLRLTKKGRFFGNRVFLEFVGNPTPDCLIENSINKQ